MKIGSKVTIPSQRLSGIVMVSRGEAPQRVFKVETPTGELIDIAETHCVPVEAERPPPPIPAPVPQERFDLVRFARVLAARTADAKGDEPRAIHALATAYLRQVRT